MARAEETTAVSATPEPAEQSWRDWLRNWAASALRTSLLGILVVGCRSMGACFGRRSVAPSVLFVHIFPADPLVILPTYRSSNTTDMERLVIACILHPIMQELVVSMQRVRPPFSKEQYQLVLESESKCWIQPWDVL